MVASRRYKNTYDSFYHSKEWQAVRRQVLDRDHYLCQVCKRAGRITPASTVHHITPLRVDYGNRLDPANLETICPACHNAEHNERAQSLEKKKSKIKIEQQKDVYEFKQNPEIY